jgi:NADPH2:quinone reductase
MRAAVYRRRGFAHEVLEVVDLPDPEPARGEVVVRLRVSGVNPTDWKARAGHGPLDRPFQVPGQDGSGDIEAVGAGVDPSRVGERVWVYHAAWQRAYGTSAQRTVVPADQAVPLPDTISYEQGAGLGIPFITAHRCVFADGPVDDRTLLVTGGAGAVGNAAIGLATWGAARVIATVSSPAKAELAARAGAEVTLDYRAEDYVDQLRAAAPDGVHRVVDVALGANLAADLEVLRPHGSVITYASEDMDPKVPTRRLMTNNQRLEFMLVYTLAPSQVAHAVTDITTALVEGRLHPLPEHRFTLDHVADAHDAVEAGAVGKVLVEIP